MITLIYIKYYIIIKNIYVVKYAEMKKAKFEASKLVQLTDRIKQLITLLAIEELKNSMALKPKHIFYKCV